MSFSKLASSLTLLAIFLLFKFKPTFGVHPLFHICSSNHQNFTANDPYETNLKELTLYLSHETATKGFSVGSKGHGQHQVYGVALCRGDVLDIECPTCVVTEAKKFEIFAHITRVQQFGMTIAYMSIKVTIYLAKLTMKT